MLRREAASWLARLQSGRDPDIERKFQRWRDADPRHGAAFDRVRRSYEQAGLLRQSRSVSALHEPAIRTPKWQPRPALAAAAAIAVLLPIGVLVIRDGRPLLAGTRSMMLMTAAGEIRQVDLPDGSRVTLDTSTKIEVDIGRSRRSAHLRYGRARFQIAPARQPFVIESATVSITTGGAIIDVEQRAEQDRVHVLAGAAEIRGSDQAPASEVALGAGESLTVNPGGAEPKSIAPSAPDWTKGMLQFDGTPLGEAVALANRYSQRHIILAGDVGTLRVTGAFRAGDTDGLAKALAGAFGLSLEKRPDGNLVLSRSTSPGSPNKRGG